jgi:hypothetical protein
MSCRLTVYDELLAFLGAHKGCGLASAGAGEPGPAGYVAWATCPYGIRWERRVTQREAVEEMVGAVFLALLN